MLWRLALFLSPFLVATVFALVYRSTQVELLGIPPARTWGDLSGAFTGAAAFFSALAVIGVLFTLRRHAVDSEKQADNFNTTLKTNSDAIDALKAAADALASQVEIITKTADAANEQAQIASEQLNLNMSRQRLARIDRLMERFLFADPPQPQGIAELDLCSNIAQGEVRSKLPRNWLISLQLLVQEIVTLETEQTAPPQIKAAAEATCADLKAHLSEQERIALCLAELTPRNRMPDDYSPSRFAKSLKAVKLFPFIPEDSPRYAAFLRAG